MYYLPAGQQLYSRLPSEAIPLSTNLVDLIDSGRVRSRTKWSVFFYRCEPYRGVLCWPENLSLTKLVFLQMKSGSAMRQVRSMVNCHSWFQERQRKGTYWICRSDCSRDTISCYSIASITYCYANVITLLHMSVWRIGHISRNFRRMSKKIF